MRPPLIQLVFALSLLACLSGCSESEPDPEPAPEPAAQAPEQAEAPAPEQSEPQASEPEPVVATNEPTPQEPIESGEPFESDAQLDVWMLLYYRNPEPERVEPAFRWLAQGERLESAADRRELAFFFGRVLAQHDQFAEHWVTAISDIELRTRLVFAQWLILANTPACDAAVLAMAEQVEDPQFATALRQMDQMPRPRALDYELDSPATMNLIWAEYAATGERKYVERVASVVHHFHEQEDAETTLLGGHAAHSLTNKAVIYPEVLAILEELAEQADGAQQEVLYNIVDDAAIALQRMRGQSTTPEQME